MPVNFGNELLSERYEYLLTVKRKKSPNPLIQTLTLRNNDGKFSDDYKMLTKDFHPPEYFY